TPVPPPTVTRTRTATPIITPSSTPLVPTATATSSLPTPTATVCPIIFSDVLPTDPFYTYIRCLACRGIVSGYSSSPPCAVAPCFLPGNNVTRGQLAKIDANAAGYGENFPSTQHTFTDVTYGSPFWVYVERVYLHGVISGYSTSPPCTTGIPCYLPGNNSTRG